MNVIATQVLFSAAIIVDRARHRKLINSQAVHLHDVCIRKRVTAHQRDGATIVEVHSRTG